MDLTKVPGLRIELASLENKIDSGLITQSELKRVVKIILILANLSRDK